MYRGKHLKVHARRPAALIISLALILSIAIGGTAAYIRAAADDITNVFTPGFVTADITETVVGNMKSDIQVTNNGNTTAFMRATLVIYWTDVIENQRVIIPQPVGGKVELGSLSNKWFQVGDIYYYTEALEPGDSSVDLMDTAITVTVPEGSLAQCHIDVRTEGIQADPTSVVESVWTDVKVVGGVLAAAK